MSLPQQVQEAKDKAEALQKEIAGGESQEAVSQEGQQDQGAENQDGLPDGEGESQQTSQPAPTQDDWEHKYKTLQGMMNKQNEDNKAALQQREAEIANMQNLIATMDAAEAPADYGALTEEELEEYGESVDLIRRSLGHEMSTFENRIRHLEALAQNFNTTVVPQVGDMAQQQQAMQKQSFINELLNVVPNALEINKRQDFRDWMLDIDPLSGMTRQTLLENAERNFDVMRVAAFFEQWLAENRQSPSAAQRQAGELERQIAPGQSRGFSPESQQPLAKSFSREQIKQFFTDVSRGAYEGKEDERKKLEQEIFEAQREGRIS